MNKLFVISWFALVVIGAVLFLVAFLYARKNKILKGDLEEVAAMKDAYFRQWVDEGHRAEELEMKVAELSKNPAQEAYLNTEVWRMGFKGEFLAKLVRSGLHTARDIEDHGVIGLVRKGFKISEIQTILKALDEYADEEVSGLLKREGV